MPTLHDFIEELQAVAKRCPLTPQVWGDAHYFLALPKYAGAGAGGARLLERDLRSLVSERLRKKEDRRLLELLFCLNETDFPDGRVPALTRRYERIAQEIGASVDVARTDRRIHALAELAFELFRLGSPADELAAQAPGGGYRYVEHNWSMTIDETDAMVERFSYATTIETVRERTRLYSFGTNLFGSAFVDEPQVRSGDQGHRYVGYVPINASDPYGELLHVVYFGRALALGERATVVVEYAARRPKGSSGSGLLCGAVSPIERLRLTVRAPASMLQKYHRIERLHGSPYSDPLRVELVEREGGVPATYDVRAPEVGHEYEVAWDDPPTMTS